MEAHGAEQTSVAQQHPEYNHDTEYSLHYGVYQLKAQSSRKARAKEQRRKTNLNGLNHNH